MGGKGTQAFTLPQRRRLFSNVLLDRTGRKRLGPLPLTALTRRSAGDDSIYRDTMLLFTPCGTWSITSSVSGPVPLLTP